MKNVCKILFSPVLVFFILSLSSAFAEVKQNDLQKSFEAGGYNKLSYDCKFSTNDEFIDIILNFNEFAKNKYKYASDHDQMIELFKEAQERDYKFISRRYC